jgi:putative membrane protein
MFRVTLILMMYWGGGWMIGIGIIGFVLLCLFVMMALRFTMWGSHNHRMGYGMGGSMDAEEILRQRYARGEITKEQFDQMLRDLRYGRN